MHKAGMIRQMIEFEANIFLSLRMLAILHILSQALYFFIYSFYRDEEFFTGKKMVSQNSPAHHVELLF